MAVSNSTYSLSDLSARFGLELRGDWEHLIDFEGTMMTGGPIDVTILANPVNRKQQTATRARAQNLKAHDADACPKQCIVAD